MGKSGSCLKLKLPFISLTLFVISLVFFETPAFTLTASIGRPYQGRLIDGVPFPSQFPGYLLRDQERSYATPEAIATVLDAIDAVRERHPDTCDILIGDFSREGGGPLNMHRSHQNGRDVDLGMYAKGNRPLDTFVSMNDENLDVAKTWILLESLLQSQHIQYIFLDRRIQRLLHQHALTQGVDPSLLEQLFADDRNSPIKHVRGHHDHIHVRFYTPWSTMAARVGEDDQPQRAEIEMAQRAYLPQKVNYYVKASDRNLAELASSFGVSQEDLCRWNQVNPHDVLTPGSCLVFYKRSFEAEPVHLARSLQPGSVADSPGLQVAFAGSSRSRGGMANFARARAGRSFMPVAKTYTIGRGDTLAKVAQRNRIDLATLCRTNGLKPTATVKPGQKIRLVSTRAASGVVQQGGPKIEKQVQTASLSRAASEEYKPAVYMASKQDTLYKIAKEQGVDLDVLCRINGLKKSATLKPGQKISLCTQEPSGKGSVPPSSSAKRTSGSSVKQKAPSPSTLQKNMKPAAIATLKAAGQQKVAGTAQKGGGKTVTGQSRVKLIKAEAKPAKKR